MCMRLITVRRRTPKIYFVIGNGCGRILICAWGNYYCLVCLGDKVFGADKKPTTVFGSRYIIFRLELFGGEHLYCYQQTWLYKDAQGRERNRLEFVRVCEKCVPV